MNKNVSVIRILVVFGLGFVLPIVLIGCIVGIVRGDEPLAPPFPQVLDIRESVEHQLITVSVMLDGEAKELVFLVYEDGSMGRWVLPGDTPHLVHFVEWVEWVANPPGLCQFRKAEPRYSGNALHKAEVRDSIEDAALRIRASLDGDGWLFQKGSCYSYLPLVAR